MRRYFSSLVLSPLLLLGCSTNKPYDAVPLDCSAGDGYEFSTVFDFEAGDTTWYQAGDCTGGRWESDAGADAGACAINPSAASPITGDVPGATIEGGRCGSLRSALIESYGHNDWGSMYAAWDLAEHPANGTGFDGIAFWARNPDRSGHAIGGTNKTILFEIGDWRQVVAQNTIPTIPPPDDFRCVPGPITTSTSGYTDTGQVTTTTRVPAPNECGNLFKVQVLTSNEWQLYLLPWESFFQETTPNRNPDGIDPRDIRIMQVNIPIGATVELWLDDISFYRKQQGDAGH